MSTNRLLQETFYDVRFTHPSTFLISGVSGSGKTFLTSSILKAKNSCFKPEIPRYIILVYTSWQDVYQEWFEAGLIHLSLSEIPDAQSLKEICSEHKDSGGSLIIFDDQLSNIDSRVSDIFTIHSHHLKISVMLLVQRLFMPNTFFRTISLNTNYIILMKNTRDRISISQLARQIFPYKTRFLVDSYIDATILPYTHLIIDLRPETLDLFRLRANIFDECITVYTQLQ